MTHRRTFLASRVFFMGYMDLLQTAIRKFDSLAVASPRFVRGSALELVSKQKRVRQESQNGDL